jgi:hypothetical protein
MDKIEMLMRQTIYTREEAEMKLRQFDGNVENAIKDYLGIPLSKPSDKLHPHQEVFRQIRYKMDSSMQEYREKNPLDMNQVIQNFQESESKKNES